jgi:hypothetical protein
MRKRAGALMSGILGKSSKNLTGCTSSIANVRA